MPKAENMASPATGQEVGQKPSEKPVVSAGKSAEKENKGSKSSKKQEPKRGEVKTESADISAGSVAAKVGQAESLSEAEQAFFNDNIREIQRLIQENDQARIAQQVMSLKARQTQSQRPAPKEAEPEVPAVQPLGANQGAAPAVNAAPAADQKLVFEAGAVDVSALAKQQARRVAGEQMTAEKKELSGFFGFFKKIFKYGYGEQVLHEKRRLEAKEKIIRENNIYANEAVSDEEKAASHKKSAAAIIGRFLSKSQGLVEVDFGERRTEVRGSTKEEQEVKGQLKQLIDDYAEGKLDEAAFEGAKRQVFAGIRNMSLQNKLDDGEVFVDNFLEIAKQVKQLKEQMLMAAGHSAAVDKLEYDLNLVLGVAKSGLRTEAQYSRVDRFIERLRKTKIGSLVNETTLALGVAGVASVMTGLGKMTASRTAAVITFGLSAGVAGVFAAVKENQMQKRERETLELREASGTSRIGEQLAEKKNQIAHLSLSVERATDKQEKKRLQKELQAVRREEAKLEAQQAFLYNRCRAQDLLSGLNAALEQGNYDNILSQLTELEARRKLSKQRHIDLWSYSRLDAVEEERRQILELRAVAIAKLAELDKQNQPKVGSQKRLEELVQAKIQELVGGPRGVNNSDEVFKAHKEKAVVKKLLQQALAGLIAGVAAQEAFSLVSDNQEGLLENLVKGNNRSLGAHDTALQAFRNYIGGGAVSGELQNQTVPNGVLRLPAGCSWLANADGSYSLSRGGDIVADNLHLNPNGSLTAEAKAALTASGLRFGEQSVFLDGPGAGGADPSPVPPEMYIEQHPEKFTSISREYWYGNDTPMYKGADGRWYGADLNELRFDWGGPTGTGINEQCNAYELNALRMTADGSFQTINGERLSDNAKELLASGRLKVLFTLSDGTQNRVVEMGVDRYTGLLQVDRNSEMGKLLFAEVNGRAVLKARFMEVAMVSGNLEDGTQKVRVFATAVGEGIKEAPGAALVPVENTVTTLAMDRQAVIPPFIPIDYRKPLEPVVKRDEPSEPTAPSYYDYYGGPQKDDLVNLHRYRPGSSNISQLTKILQLRPSGIGNVSSLIGKLGKDSENLTDKRKKKKLNITLDKDYGDVIKNDVVDIQDYRDAEDQSINQEVESLRAKYQYILEELDKLIGFDSQSDEYKSKIEKERQHYNKNRSSREPLSLTEYIDEQITRLQNQIDNILISEAKVGEKPFNPDFYEQSPLVKGLENAQEIVIIMDDPIGDAVMTIPALLSVQKYLEINNIQKPIKLVVSPICMDLFACVKDQFKGQVDLISYADVSKKFAKDKKSKFVINAKKDFQDYQSLNLPDGANRDLSQVMSVRWDSWLKEEVPKRRGLIEKYDPIPARIMRNFENMLGQKLFADINKMDHYLEKGSNADSVSASLRKKYKIKDGEQVIVISAGSSVQPKEYEPSKWEAVLSSAMNKYPNAHVMFLKDPDPRRWDRYSSLVDKLAAQHGERFSLVSESTKKFNGLMSMADVVLTPDTGLGHYASALGRPNIMLILGDPVRWSNATTDRVMHKAARDTYRRNAGTYAPAWGSPNSYYVFEKGENVGASDIDPEKINTALDKYLSAEQKSGSS